MVKNMFYVLVIVIVLSFAWITFTILTNETVEYKSEINRTNIKENRLEDNELIFDDVENSYDGFSIIPSNVKYDSINKFYTASNSYLVASYNINNKQIRLELIFKADGKFFLYHGTEEEIAYEGEYKLIDKKIYAKINKIYKANQCYESTTLITEFNIVEKNGRKVINLLIGDIEFIEIHKKYIKSTEKYSKRNEFMSC